MPTKRSLPAALKMARKARGLSQEAFSNVSSRTYLSTLERGMKSPTLSKITALCEVLDLHPLTLLALSVLPMPPSAMICRQGGRITGPHRYT